MKFLILITFLFLGNVNLSEVSFYEILGVTKQATTQEIKQAYKKLAIKLHPDKNPNAADQQKFLKITEAYETLKDPEKRHKYNLYGSRQSYTRTYDYQSQEEYNNLYYNGLYHNDPYVVTLSASSFYSYLNDGLYFINFYSPFCPPCQNLADHWKKLAEVYKDIVNVASVNCKYYNSFCYNNMRIGSYPSLLFYPDGKNGNFVLYRGAHRFDSLEEFMMMYIKSKVNVAHVSQIQNVDQPIAYVVDTDNLYTDAIMRIAYKLKGLATVVIAKENVRIKLTDNTEAVVIFKYKNTKIEIESTDEKIIVNDIVAALPKIEKIGLDKLKKIRTDLRNSHDRSWLLYFTKKGDDYMLLHQLKAALPHMHFGEIDCDALSDLCGSLQVTETPSSGLLKPGGAYQYLWRSAPAYVADAGRALNLHTLSPSDYNNILSGEMSMWMLLVAPAGAAWDHLLDPFTQASLDMIDTDIHFGIMVCTASTAQYCYRLTRDEPVIVVQNASSRHYHNGRIERDDIVEFIDLLRDTTDVELTEEQAIEVAASRDQNWVLAYMPADCRVCEQLMHEWRVVAKRVHPLRDARGGVRVGAVRCAVARGPLCGNVRAATARLYPTGRREHYAVTLQQLSQAPYMLEWIFDILADSITKLNWQVFSKSIIAEELNPSSNKKPWLVYFHSPRCYRCYEMFPEFATVSILLKDSMLYGKVNCVSERSLCHNENINSYPSLRLYLPRRGSNMATVRSISVRDFENIIEDIKPHLARFDSNMLVDLDMAIRSHIRDEL
ncbi:dnaJ homolog subfamily C member 10-like [Aricia agestis]|uniref:dnaJ homolog subfamily C member 10-like n=1 Tax=Aricia agestis TaxID=91739 RepID=UPI001C2096A2|nr:dnaJ homolog subfamily C member 10-like [Aricia agestis]